MEILLIILISVAVGVFLGRGSVKFTYGGKIVTEVTEAGTKRYSLEIDTDVDKLDQKKHVIFRVVPRQDALL